MEEEKLYVLGELYESYIDNKNGYFDDIKTERNELIISLLAVNLFYAKDNNPNICDEYINEFNNNLDLINNKLYSFGIQNQINYLINRRLKMLESSYGLVGGIDTSNYINFPNSIYLESVPVLEHELTHSIQLINDYNCKKQYGEFLSIFTEMTSALLLQEKYKDTNIYDSIIYNRINGCYSYNSELSYRNIGKSNRKMTYKSYIEMYRYLLGFIYATRLKNIYLNDEKSVLKDFNSCLKSFMSIDELLNKYNISLNNTNTISEFEEQINEYSKKYQMHR